MKLLIRKKINKFEMVDSIPPFKYHQTRTANLFNHYKIFTSILITSV